MSKRTEAAVDVMLALTMLVALVGAAMIVVGLVTQVRATVPALGLILFIVGGALYWQFGARPALRQGRNPLRGTVDGVGSIGRFVRRLFGSTKRAD